MTADTESALLRVKVTPRSSRDLIVSYTDGVLAVKLTAPPVGGAANAALLKLLAKELGLRRFQIAIRSGHSSRAKLLQIEGLSNDQLQSLLRPFAK